jgi:oxalate decarboxylase
MLAASAMGAAMTVSAARAGSFGNPDEPPQGTINAKSPGSRAMREPHDIDVICAGCNISAWT